ncbi:hypothetical protein OIU79_001491 [Salix purpurea]|uniref:Uncharacterized protein n=1 Tax=Salix purpurea TaxID=77065 RepID=A0A9Q0ZH66_SALPP|nr:hypothetical protein OIU79_001491 [Salix purpurea]
MMKYGLDSVSRNVSFMPRCVFLSWESICPGNTSFVYFSSLYLHLTKKNNIKPNILLVYLMFLLLWYEK